MNALTKIKSAFTATKKATNDIYQGLEDIREEIETKEDERKEIAGQRVDYDLAVKRLDEFIAQVKRPVENFYTGYFLAAGDFRQPLPQEAARFALGLGADTWRDILLGKINEAYKSRTGITEDKRATMIKKLDAEILALALFEEAMIRNAERTGMAVDRRTDAPPAAVLAHDSALPS